MKSTFLLNDKKTITLELMKISLQNRKVITDAPQGY